MSNPEIDPVTAESEAADAEFADEHTEPTFRDQHPEPTEGEPDESSGSDSGGMKPR